jgi:hypothetical protein
LVAMFEWLRLLPRFEPRSQRSQRRAIYEDSNVVSVGTLARSLELGKGEQLGMKKTRMSGSELIWR